jgi:hypothetical protein
VAEHSSFECTISIGAVVSELFAPVCSITMTKRRRFFWAAWWSGPPVHVPFRTPDAEGGGAATHDEARAAAESRAGRSLVVVDPLWARAWIRVLRGEPVWPSRASREPASSKPGAPRSSSTASEESVSIWELLDLPRTATLAELKAAYRRRVLETHPDHGGSDAEFRRLHAAYEEAQRRLRRPRRRS